MSFHLLESKREWLRWTGILGLAMLPVVLSSCSGSNANTRAAAPQAIQVTVASARKQDLPIFLSGLGSIQAYYTVNVKTRVDGQLVDVRFKEGQFVKQGDLLAVIDPRPY